DAIIGVVMALVSWLLLYTINPDLVKFTPLTKLPIPAASTSATGGATSAANSAAAQQQLAQCQSYCNNAGADSSSAGTTWTQNCLSGCQQNAQNAAASGSKATGGQCNQINDACNNNSSGIDPSLLKTVMAGGEGCNKNVSSDGYGSCGYSQALPNIRTACGISGTPSETCAKIQADPQLDANCAAWLIKQQGSSCGTTDAVQVGCCYNGGPSNSDCHKNPTYGTKINNYVSKYGSSTQN
ncbi:MAG: hypothetical protein P4L62_02710, partial [Candidatus Pacebacteria bacterium]|nr:hypothetical protein [Candidatus Paceibacterota bacterium]